MRPALACSLFVLLAACGGDPADETPDAGEPAVTWYQDVGPIIAERCTGCHRDGGIAPFGLTEYAQARDRASFIVNAIEDGVMPPWDAVDSDACAPRFGWKDDPRLPPDQVALIRTWYETGMAAGEPASLPEPPGTALAGVTHSVVPTAPYATAGDVDEFICFVLDPGVTELRYMTGLQLTPGNPKVVHHAVTSVIQPGEEHDALVAEVGVGQPFDCRAGTPNPAGSYLLNVWTPGQAPMETPSDLAIPLLPGSKLIVQFHYHPGGIVNEPDESRIDLRLTATPPERFYTVVAWGNAFAAPELLPGPNDGAQPVFFVPADQPAHTEEMRFQVVTDGAARFPIFAAYPHMHYIGTELSVSIERATPAPGEPAEECLVNIDRWDFDWQRTYHYDAAIDEVPTVGNGDVISLRCAYDNTLDNPFVERALTELGLTAPIDVTLGEESLDEMCLGMFLVAFDAPGAASAPPPRLQLIAAPTERAAP